MLFFAPFLAVCSLLSLAAAHGVVVNVNIDGTSYKSSQPGGQQPSDSPVRLVGNNGPVKGAANPDMACGVGGAATKPAGFVAPAKPGSTLAFSWASGGGGNWVHNVGPVMTYMAKCDGTCDKFDASNAKWFKIHEAGLKPDGRTWYQADIQAGQAFKVALPTNLQNGDFLVRHEIISLQGAMSPGGAEFYPSCTQVRISGGDGGVAPSDARSMPIYSDSDPGIQINVYQGNLDYRFPGGPISNVASPDSTPGSGSSGSGSGSGSGGYGPSSTSAPAPAPTGGAGSGSGSCKLQSRAAVHRRAAHRPQQVSRIMRRMLAELDLLEADLTE